MQQSADRLFRTKKKIAMKHIIKGMVLGILLLSGGCKSFQPVEVGEPTDLRVSSLSGSAVNLEIDLPIKNPNLYKIHVTHIRADAWINQTKAGEITNTRKISLPSRSNEVHRLKLDVSFSDLLSSGISVIEIMRQGKLNLKIEGSLTTRSFLYKKEIPFTEQKTLKLNN